GSPELAAGCVAAWPGAGYLDSHAESESDHHIGGLSGGINRGPIRYNGPQGRGSRDAREADVGFSLHHDCARPVAGFHRTARGALWEPESAGWDSDAGRFLLDVSLRATTDLVEALLCNFD